MLPFLALCCAYGSPYHRACSSAPTAGFVFAPPGDMRPSRQLDAKKTALCASGDGTEPLAQRQAVKQVKQVLQTVYGDADDSFWEYRKLAIEQASVAAPYSLSVDTGDLTYVFTFLQHNYLPLPT